MNDKEQDLKLIGVTVSTPLRKNDKAYAHRFYCDISDCPLLDRNECINVSNFSSCFYGRYERVIGWTSRARKYHSWLKEWRAKRDEYPIGPPREESIQRIGDYYWLPYAHFTHEHNKGIGLEFVRWSGIIGSGLPFVHHTNFTAENIAKMMDANPKTYIDRVPIRAYKQSSLPNFFSDLREYDKDLFSRVVDIDERALEYANMGSAFSVTLGWLKSNKWSGKARINGYECFVYSSGNVSIKGVNVPDFPRATRTELDAKLPEDTEVWPDIDHYGAMTLKARALEEGALVSTSPRDRRR